MKPLNPNLLFSFLLLLVLFPLDAKAQMGVEEQEVLETLNTQLGHAIAGEIEENGRYLHPRVVFWGAYSPIPGVPKSGEDGNRLWKIERDNSSVRNLGFYTVPLTVEVVGNTAILNVYLYILTKPAPDGEPEWEQILLHNTWVKEDGRWLLLATYNTSTED